MHKMLIAMNTQRLVRETARAQAAMLSATARDEVGCSDLRGNGSRSLSQSSGSHHSCFGIQLQIADAGTTIAVLLWGSSTPALSLPLACAKHTFEQRKEEGQWNWFTEGWVRSPLQAIFLLRDTLADILLWQCQRCPSSVLRPKSCGIQKCKFLILSFTSTPLFWDFAGSSLKIHAPNLSSQEVFFSFLLVSCTYGMHNYFIYFHVPLFLHTITSLPEVILMCPFYGISCWRTKYLQPIKSKTTGKQK